MGRARLLTGEGRTWLREEAWSWLSAEQRALVETHFELIDLLNSPIHDLDGRIEAKSREHPAASLLLDDSRNRAVSGSAPDRRDHADLPILHCRKACLLCGTGPTTKQSEEGKPKHGRLPEGANRWARNALVSAIPTHMRASPQSSLGQYFTRQKERLGMPTARVAAARKLCRIVHAMLSTGEVWRG